MTFCKYNILSNSVQNVVLLICFDLTQLSECIEEEEILKWRYDNPQKYTSVHKMDFTFGL